MVETFRLISTTGFTIYSGKAYIERARAKATQMAKIRDENIRMDLKTPSGTWLNYGTFRPDGLMKNVFGLYKQSDDFRKFYPKNK